MKQIALVFSLVAVTISFTACNDSGSSNAGKANFVAAKLEEAIPGVSISTAKLKTERGNWVVFSATSGGPVQHIAINLDLFNKSMDAATVYGTLLGAGASGYEQVMPTGSYGNFYISGAGNVYEETQATAKDLEKAAAIVEGVKYQAFAQSLTDNYGLSEDRSSQVAKLAMNWSQLSKARAMTNSDAEAFSMDLLGVNVSEMQAAFVRSQLGDSTSLNHLMERAAAVNGVSPEQMNQIVSEIISN